jgi:hypothetical protein
MTSNRIAAPVVEQGSDSCVCLTLTRLVGLFLLAREVGYGLGIFERVVDEGHVLVFGFHVRCAFVVALVIRVFHAESPPSESSMPYNPIISGSSVL